MATPPTDSPGRMLPERIGVTIQMPRTRARLATPTAARTATRRTVAISVRSRLAAGVRLAWACLERGRAGAFGLPSAATQSVVMVPPAMAALCGTHRGEKADHLPEHLDPCNRSARSDASIPAGRTDAPISVPARW